MKVYKSKISGDAIECDLILFKNYQKGKLLINVDKGFGEGEEIYYDIKFYILGDVDKPEDKDNRIWVARNGYHIIYEKLQQIDINCIRILKSGKWVEDIKAHIKELEKEKLIIEKEKIENKKRIIQKKQEIIDSY